MRNTGIAMVVLSAGILFCGASLAQDMNGMGANTMMPGMEHGMMRSKMGQHMMRCPQMERSVIATTDGGVVLVIGNKLIKYDKNLNLVKEVEIKVDMASMQKNMMETMKNCPMMMRQDTTDAMPGKPDAETSLPAPAKN